MNRYCSSPVLKMGVFKELLRRNFGQRYNRAVEMTRLIEVRYASLPHSLGS